MHGRTRVYAWDVQTVPLLDGNNWRNDVRQRLYPREQLYVSLAYWCDDGRNLWVMRPFRILFRAHSLLFYKYHNFYQLQKPDVLNDGNNFEWPNINMESSIFARQSGVKAQSRLPSYSHNRRPYNYRSFALCTYLRTHETRIHWFFRFMWPSSVANPYSKTN
jgi:hypothetical protein